MNWKVYIITGLVFGICFLFFYESIVEGMIVFVKGLWFFLGRTPLDKPSIASQSLISLGSIVIGFIMLKPIGEYLFQKYLVKEGKVFKNE